VGHEIDKMEDRLGRLDAAREALAVRQVSAGLRANGRVKFRILDPQDGAQTADLAIGLK
jgi:hypothetical protein